MSIILIVLGIIISLFVLLFLFCFTSIRMDILFKREKGDDWGEIKLYALFGLIRYRYEIPELKFEGLDKGVEVESKTKSKTVSVQTTDEKDELKIDRKIIEKMEDIYYELMDRIAFFQKTIRWLLSKVTSEKFVWVTTIGTGDAAEAGMLTGVAWGIKTTLVSLLGRYIQWDQPPQLYVDPNFNLAVLETHFHSIIRFKIGHAILGIIRLLLHMRKGREQKWQENTPFKA